MTGIQRGRIEVFVPLRRWDSTARRAFGVTIIRAIEDRWEDGSEDQWEDRWEDRSEDRSEDQWEDRWSVT